MYVNRSSDYTYSGDISGSGSLTKQAAGVLTLSGNNTFTGKTSVTGGAISISADGKLGNAPGSAVADQLSLSGSTLRITGGTTIATNRGITISGGSTFNSSGIGTSANFNVDSIIAGSGGLTLAANGDTSDTGGGVGGNLHLNNTSNSFTGTVNITSGVVSFSGDGAFGNTSNVINISGGGLVATSNRSLPSSRAITLSGGGDKIFRVYGSQSLTIDGSISGTGDVHHTDGGTLTLNGALGFTGNLEAVKGTTAISNTGNSFSGWAHILSGSTLRLDAGNVIPNSSTVLMYGGTFNVNGQTETIGSLTTGSSGDTAASVTLGSGNLTVTSNSLPSGMTSGYSVATWHGNISGTGGITYNQSSGTGVDWILATANSYSGGTSVLAGRIRAQNTGAFGSGAVTVGAGGAAYLVASGGTFGNNFSLTGRGPNESGSYYGALRVAGNEDVSGQITLNASANPVNIRNDAGADLGGGGLVLSGKVTGSGGLEKSGPGTVRLTNTTNDFSGNITIAEGTLQTNDNLQFGNASNSIVFNGGTFQQYGGAALTIGSGHTLTATAGSFIRLHVWGGGSITVNGPITGASAGGLIKTDGGTLILANSGNSYAGYTHITDSSQIRLDADNVIPNTSNVLMYGGSTLNINGHTETIAGVHVGSSGDTTATLQLGSGGNLTVTGTSMPGGSPTNIGGDFYAKITGTGNITYNHSSNSQANWTWRNTANDFAGNITITSGRIQALEASLGNAGNDIIFNGDVVATLNNGEGKASLQVTNGTSLTLNSGRTITLNSGKEGTMYVWGSTTMQIDGQITGGGNLRKEDGGVLLLTNTSNNYTGQTKLAYGELKLGAANVLPDATTVVVGNNGVLNLNGLTDTVSYIAGDGGTGGYISGSSGILFVNGAGSSTYTGRISNDIGGANNGAIVAYNGAGTLTLAGTQDNSGGRARVDSGTLILGKTSSGSVHAVGTGNITGLFINGGTAQLGGTGNDQIYTESNVAMTGGTFDLNARNEGFRGLTGAAGTVVNAGGGTSSLVLGESSVGADTYTFSGTISSGAGTINLTKRGSGTQVLEGSNTFGGTVTVLDGGVLSVPAVAATGVAQPLGTGASPLSLQQGSILRFTGASGSTDRALALSTTNGGQIDVTAGTLTLSGSITGTAANFTKRGAGTFNQSGTGDWSGDTFIAGGTYNVTSSGSILNSGVIELTGGSTLNVDSSTVVRASTINLVSGTVNLNAGTLRTNGITMASGTAFNWSAGTLTMQTESSGSSGSTDRRTPGSSASAQPVYEGRIINIAGAAAAITVPTGSTLDLGPTYGSLGMRYDQIKIAGSLDISAASDVLNFEFNPLFFRPSSFGADAAGTLILVDANSFTGTFSAITGIVSDSQGFAAAPGSGSVVGVLGTSTLNPLTDIPRNTYYLEYETDTGNILFHYRLGASVPEPASAGLLVAGALLLRALGRRKG
ncbi:MAG: autotransporter-associated beta strand repeat-containing protein [Kiritimatiellia bacterium]